MKGVMIMNNYDKLKLAIYESTFEEPEKRYMLNLADQYFQEGVIRRAFSRSDTNKKALTVKKCWITDQSIPSEKTATKTMEVLKSKSGDMINLFPPNIIHVLSVTNTPQSEFIKIVDKTDHEKYKKYMFNEIKETFIEDQKMSEELQDKLKGLETKEEKDSCIQKYIDSHKSNGNLRYTKGKIYVSKLKSETNKKAMDFCSKNKIHVIALDGGGNMLLYSIANGKFYDYFHEEDGATDLSWLRSGITYKDAMKFSEELQDSSEDK